MEVLWKSIPGYEGIYEISTAGQVRGKNGPRKTLLTWDGYAYVKLCNRGKEKKHKIHRLVAIAFIPNPHIFAVVNHKNEIKTDNRVENLEWCDRVYNTNFGERNRKAGIGIRKANSKRVSRFDKAGNYIDSFDSIKIAAAALNIMPSAISRCANAKRKTAGGFVWKYTAKGQPENSYKP